MHKFKHEWQFAASYRADDKIRHYSIWYCPCGVRKTVYTRRNYDKNRIER